MSTPNVLTLAPPGAEKSDNPWHIKEYRAAEFRAYAAACSTTSGCSACSTPASSASMSWRLPAAGMPSMPGCGITKPFYDRFTPAIAASDFALHEAGLDGALDFLAVCR